jgi:hypothetical protein
VLLSGDECPLVGEVSPSHDSVVCTAPPRRINADTLLVVTSGSLVSNALRLSFDVPLVTSAEPPVITAMAHTQPATVRVGGVNFGVVLPLVPSSHRVAIGGYPCLAVSWLSDAVLMCLFAEELTVGVHNVTVWLRDDVSRASSVSVRAECPPSFYGADGSLCAVCPEGSECDGGMSDPAAIRGFYRVSRAVFAQCEPREACLGGVNSTCHRNYGGDRCADCVVGTYRCVLRVVQRGYVVACFELFRRCCFPRLVFCRLRGKCAMCPNTAWLLFLGFFIVIAVLVAASLYISKRRVNLAGLGIGVVSHRHHVVIVSCVAGLHPQRVVAPARALALCHSLSLPPSLPPPLSLSLSLSLFISRGLSPPLSLVIFLSLSLILLLTFSVTTLHTA